MHVSQHAMVIRFCPASQYLRKVMSHKVPSIHLSYTTYHMCFHVKTQTCSLIFKFPVLGKVWKPRCPLFVAIESSVLPLDFCQFLFENSSANTSPCSPCDHCFWWTSIRGLPVFFLVPPSSVPFSLNVILYVKETIYVCVCYNTHIRIYIYNYRYMCTYTCKKTLACIYILYYPLHVKSRWQICEKNSAPLRSEVRQKKTDSWPASARAKFSRRVSRIQPSLAHIPRIGSVTYHIYITRSSSHKPYNPIQKWGLIHI